MKKSIEEGGGKSKDERRGVRRIRREDEWSEENGGKGRKKDLKLGGKKSEELGERWQEEVGE